MKIHIFFSLLILPLFLSGIWPSTASPLKNKANSFVKFDQIRLAPGKYEVNKDITVNCNLIIEPGVTITFHEDTQLTVYGNIVAIGEQKKPIIFQGKDGEYWRGISIIGSNQDDYTKNLLGYFGKEKIWDSHIKVVNDQHIIREESYKTQKNNSLNDLFHKNYFSEKEYSIFKDCNFHNFAPTSAEGEDLEKAKKTIFYMDSMVFFRNKAAIVSNNTNLIMTNCKIEDVSIIGALKVTNGDLLLKNNSFLLNNRTIKSILVGNSAFIMSNNKLFGNDGKDRRGCHDGFFIVRSIGYISENIITEKADDAIDIKNSLVIIENNEINSSKDSAVNACKKSIILSTGNTFSNNKNAYCVKRESHLIIENDKFSNNLYIVRPEPDSQLTTLMDIKDSQFLNNTFICSENSDNIKLHVQALTESLEQNQCELNVSEDAAEMRNDFMRIWSSEKFSPKMFFEKTKENTLAKVPHSFSKD